MNERLYPEPPHLDAAFCFRSGTTADNFLLVCSVLSLNGGLATGERDLAQCEVSRAFATVAELNTSPQDEPYDGDALYSRSGSWPVRVGYRGAAFGYAVVRYGILTDRAPAHEHPISVTFSAAPFEVWDDGEVDEKNRLIDLVATVKSVFRTVCESGKVVYGALLFERELPGPTELRLGNAQLGPELFLSSDLSATSVGAEIREVLSPCTSEYWQTGTYWSASEFFNSERRAVTISAKAANRIALLVGRALGEIGK